ncbi:hypothetical protein Tco_0898802 [Tanacetum coccineum]
MSESEDSTVTYTEVSSPFEDLSDIGSPRVVIHGHNGLPMMPEDPYAYVEAVLQAPPSQDYVPVPKKPEQAPPSPDFIPEPPLHAAVSPTADSPGYITDSDPEVDPEEDDMDPKEDPSDYPINRDDEEEEDKEESSRDDANDEEEDKDEDEHFAISTLLPLPLTLYSSPLPQTQSPPLSVSSPLPMSPPLLPASPTHPMGYRAAMIRADVPEVTLPPRKRLCIALGPKYEVRESPSTHTTRPTRGFRVDYGFVGTLDAEIGRNPDREIGYGITDISEDPYKIVEEKPVTDVAKLGQRMTNFVMIVRKDTDENYRRLDDAQDDRSLMSG